MLLSPNEAAVVAHVMLRLETLQGTIHVSLHNVDVHDTSRGAVLIICHGTAEFETYDSRHEFLRAYGVGA